MCDTDLIDAYDLAENGRGGAEIRARLSRWWQSSADRRVRPRRERAGGGAGIRARLLGRHGRRTEA